MSPDQHDIGALYAAMQAAVAPLREDLRELRTELRDRFRDEVVPRHEIELYRRKTDDRLEAIETDRAGQSSRLIAVGGFLVSLASAAVAFFR